MSRTAELRNSMYDNESDFAAAAIDLAEELEIELGVLQRENAALRGRMAAIFKIAMDCINGRISDIEALQRLEVHAASAGNEDGELPR